MAIGLFGVLLGAVGQLLPTPSAIAATGINHTINFQGKVVNSNGTNVTDGSYTFVFKLYSVSSGGSAVWTESKSLTVTDGVFQTNLGDTTSLPGSVDFNTDNIFLGINFNSDGEMSPRIQFTAAPYAFNSEKLGGLTAAQFAQLNPSSAQSGSLNVTGSVQAATSLQAPLVDTATAVALGIGTGTATSVTVGRTTTPFTIQGNASSTFTATNGSFTTTVGFTTPTANNSITFPNAGGTLCTTVASTCSGTYQAAGSYLAKNAADTSSFAVTASNYLYGFTNSSSAVASGVLKLDNGTNTGDTLLVTSAGNPGAGSALIVANNTNASPGGTNLIDLQANSVSKFSVSAGGAVTTASTINGQTISSAASFTGTVTAATSLLAPLIDTASAGTLSVGTATATAVSIGTASSTTTVNGALTVATGKTLTAGGALTQSGGTASLNASSNNATNINTGSSTGTVTIGGGSAPLVIDSTNFDVSSAGALSGVTTIATSGTINSQTISSTANFTGTLTVQGSNALTLGVTGSTTGAEIFKGATAASGSITLIGQTNPTGAQTITLPDASGTVCLQASAACGFATGTSGSYIQNQNAAQQASSNFWISGTGRADTSLLTPLVDVPAAGTLSVGTATATAVSIGTASATTTINGALTVATGKTLTAGGALTQSGGAVSLNASSNNNTSINTGTSTGTITLGGGSAPLVIDSTNFDVSSAGALSGITTIATSSTINSQTISSTANFTGTVTVQGSSALTLGVTGSATGAIAFKGATAASGTINLVGQANPTGTQTLTLPNETGTLCTSATGSTTCAGNYIVNEDSTGNVQANANIAIQSSADASVTLNLKERATQSANVFQIIDSTNVAMLTFDAFGALHLISGKATFDKAVGIGDTASTGQALRVATSAVGDIGLTVNTVNGQTGDVVQYNGQGGRSVIYNAAGTLAVTTGTAQTADAMSAALGNTSGTITNGLLVNRSASGGTTTNGVNVTNTLGTLTNGVSINQSGGTLTNGLSFGGTIGTDINRASGTLTILGGGGITVKSTASSSANSGDITVATGNVTGGSALSTGTLNLKTGDGSGTNTSSGNVNLDTGAKTGTGFAGNINIGGTNAPNVNIGRAAATVTIQGLAGTGASGTSLILSSGGFATTINAVAPTANRTISFPDAGGTVCTTTASTCNGTYQAAGSYLLQNPAANQTSTSGFAGYQYTFSQTSAGAGGNLQLQNSGTNAALAITQNTTPSAGQAALLVNGATGITGNLLDLQLNSVSKFKVDTTGAATLTSTLNGQTISAAANFTGTVTAASAVTVSAGGIAVTGNSSITGTLQVSSAFTVSAGGASISGGLNNNTGGITATGAISGATTISLNSTISGGTTYTASTSLVAPLVNSADTSTGTTNSGTLTLRSGNATGATSNSGNVSLDAGTATGTAGTVSIGTGNSSGTTVGRSGASLSLQGNGSSALTATTGANTVTVNFATINGSGTYQFASPTANSTYTICTTDLNSCGASSSGYLRKGVVETDNVNVATNGTLLTLSNSGGASTSTLKVDNGAGTNSALNVVAAANPAASNALIFAKLTNASVSGNLIDLWSGASGGETSKFSVNAAGAVLTASTINGQTISSAASFTGTVTTASTLTVSAGGLTVSGTGTFNNALTATGAFTASGGASISTGLNNNAGGITNAGAVSGLTSLQFSSAGTIDTNSAVSIGIGGANASALNLGRSGITTTTSGTSQVGASAGTGAFVNNGTTKNTTLAISNLDYSGSGNSGAIGTAAATVDLYTSFTINQSTAGQTLTIPTPTVGAAASTGRVIYIANIGSTSFTLLSGGATLNAGSTATLLFNGTTWTFAGADGSSILNQNTAAQSANFWINGTGRAATSLLTPSLDVISAGSLSLGSSTATSINMGGSNITGNITLQTNASSAGVVVKTSTNSATALTVQNAIGAAVLRVGTTDTNLITNPDIEAAISSSDWPTTGYGSGVTASQVNSTAYSGSASLQVVTTGTASTGAQNKLGAALAVSTTYTLSFYGKLNSGSFTDIAAAYSRDGTAGTEVACANYNTQTIVTGGWTRVTCTIATTSTAGTTSAYIAIRQTAGASRTFFLDSVQIEAANNIASLEGAGSLALNAVVTSPLGLRNTENSTTAFTIQNAAATTIFNVDTLNNVVTASSQLTIGTGANTVTFSGSTFEPTLAGTARHTKNIKLTAEYAGAVLDSGGQSSVTGTMTAAFDSTNFVSYYNWTTSQATAQTYDIVIRVPIPDDWSAWNGNPTFKDEVSSTAAGQSLTVQSITNSSNATDATFGTYTITPGSINTWTSNSANALASSGYAAGGTMTIRLRLSAINNNSVQMGDITLPYLSRW